MTELKHNVLAQVDTVPPRTLMHPLVERMLTTNPTPEALEKILGLQRDWENNEARRAYTSALVELKRDLPPFLLKDKTVAFNNVRYTHTSLAGAMDTVTPHLTNHGFALTWTPGTNDKGGVTVTAKLTHRLGHSEQATLTAPPDMSGSKSSAQGIASTITLLQRYAALSLLGMASADMKEPKGDVEPDADTVDTARNMRAMADLVKGGKTRLEIEEYVGKVVSIWTLHDLGKLKEWVAPKPAPEAPAGPKVGKEGLQALKKIMTTYKLSPEEFLALVEGEIDRKLVNGSVDLLESECLKIMNVFTNVETGAYTLKDGKIVRPPN